MKWDDKTPEAHAFFSWAWCSGFQFIIRKRGDGRYRWDVSFDCHLLKWGHESSMKAAKEAVETWARAWAASMIRDLDKGKEAKP